MWSASMLVTTASTGIRFRNEASTRRPRRRCRPEPSREFAPALFSCRRSRRSGPAGLASTLVTSGWWWSCRACRRWRCPAAASARPASPRAAPPGCAFARGDHLGLSPFTAVEVTTASAPAMLRARRGPMATRDAQRARRREVALSLWSGARQWCSLRFAASRRCRSCRRRRRRRMDVLDRRVSCGHQPLI